MDFDESILREADIRGIYPSQINGDFAFRLGCVFGSYVKKLKVYSVVVGHDNRIGGPNLTKMLIEGILSTGIDVVYIGLVTTPMFNFASRKAGLEYGIMITASHNTKEDNGFKIYGKNYQHINGDEKEIIFKNLCDKEYKFEEGHGEINHVDISDAYAKNVAESVKIGKNNLKVVIDCGNGTVSTIIRKIYDRLPFEVTYLFCDSNSNFVNHHPDPSVRENLEKLSIAVKHNRADLGIAYDGDGDRVGIVDNLGNIIDSDCMISFISKNILRENPNSSILIDVKCSNDLIDSIEQNGGKVVIECSSSATQERIIDEKNILFGGGYSNHVFFHDRHPGYDDGVYAGLRIQEILTNQDSSLNDLIKDFKKRVNTDEIRIKVTDEIKFSIIDKVKDYCDDKKYKYTTVDGIKVYINDSWALIRASHTGPNLTLRFEALNLEDLEIIQDEFISLVESIK